MVIASLSRENISIFSIFENREKFSTQSKGLFLRNNCKMPRKKIPTCDFYKKRHKDREFQSQKSKSKSSFGNEVEFLINCSLAFCMTFVKFGSNSRVCFNNKPPLLINNSLPDADSGGDA